MNYIRQTPTEECPLTKEKESWSFSDCCGFRSIIGSFAGLTVVITAALILQLVYDDNAFQGKLNVHGAVATDNTNCSQIGTKILRKGGNAIDAAIAATFCMVVVAPHKTGLGSGGYIMIYSHENQEKPKIVDFLSDTVPDEFENNKIRIPALLRGLEYAHSIYGKLPWYQILEPSINLARNGFEISRDLAYEASNNSNFGIFKHVSAGEIKTLPQLANTLEIVSNLGTSAFYNGTLTKKIFSNKITNVKLLSGMSEYQPRLISAQESILSQYAVFFPSNLNYIQAIFEEWNRLNITVENASLIESEINIAETLIKLVRQFKIPFINYTEKRRYTGVSSVDWHDTYVTVITGLSAPLDATYETEAGFYFDNVDDKNSLSSLTPIIFYDDSAVCGLRGVFSTDDPMIAEQILYNLLLHSMNVSAAIEYSRFYILPDGIATENDERHPANKLLHDSLIAIDTASKVDANMIMKSVNVIIKRKNLISGHSDSRGDGLASRF